mgnify:CR=1 FL=1
MTTTATDALRARSMSLLRAAGIHGRERRANVVQAAGGKPRVLRLVISTAKAVPGERAFRLELNETHTLEAAIELVQRLVQKPLEFAPPRVRDEVQRIQDRHAAREARLLAMAETARSAAPALSNEKLYGKGIQSMPL